MMMELCSIKFGDGSIKMEPFDVCENLNKEEKEKVNNFLNTLTVEEFDALTIICKEIYRIGQRNADN